MRVSPQLARTRILEERTFFVGMAGVFLLLVFLGFAPSYYLRGIVRPYAPLVPPTPLVHLHALLFSSWVALFVVQTGLVAARRTDLHRRLGVLGVVLASAMILVGTLTALRQAARGSGPPSLPPLTWLAVPFFDILVFAVLVGAALALRRKPQSHKRLMFVTMVALMSPAIGRMPTPSFLNDYVVTFVLPDLGLLALAAWDLRASGRVHRVTVLAGGFLIMSQVVRVLIWSSAPWLAFARWAVALVS
jgi:hypothetical protein